MILEITQHEHPALRTKGRPVGQVNDDIRRLAEDMIETMRHAEGIGLAAQQVGRPLQLFVLEVPQMENRPSMMRIDGELASFEDFMPLVLLNPKIEPFGKRLSESEGCLSFPGLRANVVRPFSVRLKAQSLDGAAIEFEADGLLARAVQHEFDHLQGVLFIDRLNPQESGALPSEIRRLMRPVPK